VTGIEALVSDAKALDLDGVRDKLKQLVPEYTPSENRLSAKVIPHPAAAQSNGI